MAFQKSHCSAKTGRLRRQKKERKSVARREGSRRATLFLSVRGEVGNTFDDF